MATPSPREKLREHVAGGWGRRSGRTQMLAIVPDHDYHEREISVSVWDHALLSTRIARLHGAKEEQ